MQRKVITTGSTNTEHEAVAWLKAHGAETHIYQEITIITLPENALLERDGYDWRYTVGFHDKEGTLENNFVEIELDINANETVLRLKQEAPEEATSTI